MTDIRIEYSADSRACLFCLFHFMRMSVDHPAPGREQWRAVTDESLRGTSELCPGARPAYALSMTSLPSAQSLSHRDASESIVTVRNSLACFVSGAYRHHFALPLHRLPPRRAGADRRAGASLRLQATRTWHRGQAQARPGRSRPADDSERLGCLEAPASAVQVSPVVWPVPRPIF